MMTSKRGMRTGGQRKVIELLRSRGVNVSVLLSTLRASSAHMTLQHP